MSRLAHQSVSLSAMDRATVLIDRQAALQDTHRRLQDSLARAQAALPCRCMPPGFRRLFGLVEEPPVGESIRAQMRELEKEIQGTQDQVESTLDELEVLLTEKYGQDDPCLQGIWEYRDGETSWGVVLDLANSRYMTEGTFLEDVTDLDSFLSEHPALAKRASTKRLDLRKPVNLTTASLTKLLVDDSPDGSVHDYLEV